MTEDTHILDFPVKQEIVDIYNQPNRYYHNILHIEEMLSGLKHFRHQLDNKTYWSMALAIIFHDVIQRSNGTKSDEEASYEFAAEHVEKHKEFYEVHYNFDILSVRKFILATSYGFFHNCYENSLIMYLDLFRFTDDKAHRQNHIEILKELPNINIEYFIRQRVQLLDNLAHKLEKNLKETNNLPFDDIINGIHKSIQTLKSMTFNIGIYPGSFNPLHKGHKNIIEQAEKVFDIVELVQGVNPEKEESVPLQSKNYRVTHHSGYIGNIFKQTEYTDYSVIRGLRNASDLQYEADYKQNLIDLGLNVPFVYFISNPELSHISSSSIRTAEKLDLAIDKWL